MITTPEPTPEVRHYLLIESNMQYAIKLARIEVVATWEHPKKGPSVRVEKRVAEDLVDVPRDVIGSPFVANICGRELAFQYQQFGSDHYYGWTISPAEHARLARLITLAPAVEESSKLAAYTV